MPQKPSPKLSVILPVYNGGPFLIEAIESILSQTVADFELIIINDGSTDNSAEIIAGFHDPRIRVITQANQGLRGALNVGIANSTGTFIARMDQDDISLPERFEKQIKFLETHPDYILVGTTYAFMNEQDAITGIFPALLDDEDLKRELYTKSPFGHGTVMLRAAKLKNGGYKYSQEAVHMEDYDLWLRFSAEGKYANLPEILYLWRRSSTNTTTVHADIQQKNAHALRDRTLDNYDLRNLTRWLGWKNLRKYQNTTATIKGVRVGVQRRDAHCSLYITLAWLLFRQKELGKALVCFSYGVLISPMYTIGAAGRLLRGKV